VRLIEVKSIKRTEKEQATTTALTQRMQRKNAKVAEESTGCGVYFLDNREF
jgi:hypothetical protein